MERTSYLSCGTPTMGDGRFCQGCGMALKREAPSAAAAPMATPQLWDQGPASASYPAGLLPPVTSDPTVGLVWVDIDGRTKVPDIGCVLLSTHFFSLVTVTQREASLHRPDRGHRRRSSGQMCGISKVDLSAGDQRTRFRRVGLSGSEASRRRRTTAVHLVEGHP